jgi:hypothetical protein
VLFDLYIEGMRRSSDLAGEFTLPASRPAAVDHDFARVVAVEGAALVASANGTVLRIEPGAARVRVVFRDEPGTAHVRLVDSASREPVTTVRGLRLAYLFGSDLGGRAVYDFDEDTGLGGWIPIREGALPEALDIQADPAGVVVEFAAPGFAPKRVPLAEIRGRMLVPVDPVPACVTGSVALDMRVIDSPDDPPSEVAASIRAKEGEPAVDTSGIRGLPRSLGRFRIDDLPHGAWVLEVSWTAGSTVVRAKREFEYRGVTVDLGEIAPGGGATARARAVDSAGEPMPQARVVVVREGEDPGQARVLAPGEDGWVAFSDLEPGVPHRVVALGMPSPFEKEIRTAADGKQVEVELSWPERLVPCRIGLFVDGRKVANADGSRTIPATVHESPLPRDAAAWNADGTFAARLVPGTYRFSVYATPEGGGDLVLFAGEVTVPSGDFFETRLELRREGR